MSAIRWNDVVVYPEDMTEDQPTSKPYYQIADEGYRAFREQEQAKEEKNIRQALGRMGMRLRKERDQDTGESFYCIVTPEEKPLFGSGYTLTLKDVSEIAESEAKAQRKG